MEKIALAKKIEFKDGAEKFEGQIIVEPLYPGYGMTLGNSLRRVLLSSLPGAAVVGVKVKGVSHEFTSLEHVKEDALEIVLNLKQLRLKMHTEEEVKLELSVSGKKVVTAGDIAKNSQVEIINPELVIANITDPAGNLQLEIYAQAGRGYRMLEGGKRENAEIGFIEMDSVFSPVLSVSIKVENVRVGKMTNWDRVVLNVKTDGTVTYQDAFTKSVEMLLEQFGALLAPAKDDIAEVVVEEEVATEEVVVEEDKKKKSKK